MRRLLHTPAGMLLRRIALLYAVLMLCRAAFWAYNAAQLGALPQTGLRQLLGGALLFDTASVVYADGLFVLLSLLPLHLRERRWYRNLLFGYYVAVNSLFVVAANLADAVYFRYTQKRFTADEIFFADNDNSLQLVGKFMAENIPLLLAGIGLIALLALAGGRKARPEPLCRRPLCYYGGGTVLLVVAALLSVAGMRGGVTRMTRPVTLSNATLYASDNARANLILSNPFCILRTVGSGGKINYERYFAPEELDGIYTPVHRPDSVGAAPLEGRNVVVFVMESMSAEHSAHLRPDLYADRPEKGFTPFLDSLMRNGLCFRRMYANGTRSIQALPAVLGSIPSFKTPFVLMPQALAPTRQLPRILRDKGYATAFFCGSAAGSMGFGAYARSAGIERLYSREDYEARHGRDDFDGYWGIWDESFLQYAGEEMNALPEPFFAALFTLSSHHPFVVPDAYRDLLPEGLTRNHKCVAYTDNAFRRFFARYAGEEWFRRTVFVFVADHVSSEKFADATRVFPGDHHIIGLLYTPDGALRGRYDEAVSQIDLMPTLFSLLNMSYDSRFYGRSVFDPDYTNRAFIATYQDLGYLEGDTFTILSPVRRVEQYRVVPTEKNPHNLEPAAKTDKEQVNRAIAYYQTSCKWHKR